MSEHRAFELPLAEIALHYPVAVAFGGGLNSTAELAKWALDEYAPVHRIFFADTGCERPETYENVERFSEWLVQHGMPAIEITRKGGRAETLEEYSLRTRHLPSLAYGRKGCSWKFKIEPQNREINRWRAARDAWARGDKVVKLIGYGAEEQKRISKARIEDEKCWYRFPLDEWQMYRSDCEKLVRRVLPWSVGKSSCFFCPAMKKPEINDLQAKHPELLARALVMEQTSADAGNSRTTKGLGRQFAWADYVKGLPVPDAPAATCMYCVDE